MHVERTTDPAVLRWVVDDPLLSAAPPGPRQPPEDSPLGALVAEGLVTQITVGSGDLRVSVDDPSRWPDIARAVNDAIVDELDSEPEWLVGHAESECRPPAPPTIAEIQSLVNQAVGAITEHHGGGVEVTEVDATKVTVRLHGACRGCHLATDTIHHVVASAVRRAHPMLSSVVIENARATTTRSNL